MAAVLLFACVVFLALMPAAVGRDCGGASVTHLQMLAAKSYQVMSARLAPESPEHRGKFLGLNSSRPPLYSDQSRSWLLPYRAQLADGSLREGHAIVTCDDRVEFTG